MSITSLNPIGMPPLSPEPQPGGLNEKKIIRRWLDSTIIRLCTISLLFMVGFGAGYIWGMWEGMKIVDEARANFETRYATVLLEPNQGQDFIMGALGLLLGTPAGVVKMAQGLAPPEPRWILKGKQVPMSSVEGAHFVWLDTKTQATEGPFKPEAVK